MKRENIEPPTNRLTSLLLTLWDYAFDVKYQQGKKIFVSNVSNMLYRLHIEADHDVHDIMPLNFLQHLNI